MALPDMADRLEDKQVDSEGGLESPKMFKIRSYQLEMLEESMRRNIIVAMDTGSGKTLIAILRIKEELERCPKEKLCWVLCPTVELAFQQYEVVQKQLPAFQARVLSGADKVEYWTKQWIWDEVLKDIRIVVSTHQVLLDALGHAFVKMQQIALMVFDEAHSCINNHPSSRILQNFYHKTASSERPTILGLTASPVVNSRVGSLALLETNLNAIARTPKLHREELLRYVHPPKLLKLIYRSIFQGSSALTSLQRIYRTLDIEQDPWIRKMRSDPNTCDCAALHKALRTRKTYSHDHIKDLLTKAIAVNGQLGSWPTNYYLHQCIERFLKGIVDDSITIDVFGDEKVYLREKLKTIPPPELEQTLSATWPCLTPKVQELITFLKKEESPDFSGLIFVQTRAEVAVLSHVLGTHIPSFEISTFVGASSYAGRKGAISELVDVKNQKTTLDDLRHGRKNLIVTTNALEEGIDVSRCKLVVCFERPRNLKSFIQRRGRARKSDSKYVIMFDEEESGLVEMWSALEDEMRKTYMDYIRELEEMKKEEALDEDTSGSPPILDRTTGAIVSIDNAVEHLYHFCATLPAAPFVDSRPLFSFQNHSSELRKRIISATVLLPNSVDPSVRQVAGKFCWETEKTAKRDAALECYRALYHAGLIDEHLLPLGHVDEEVDEAYKAVEKRPNLVEVCSQFDPWLSVAKNWQAATKLCVAKVKMFDQETVCSEMLLLLPCDVPRVDVLDLTWNENEILKIVVERSTQSFGIEDINFALSATHLLLRSVFRGRLDYREDFTAPFVPLDTPDLITWVEKYKGTVKATEIREYETNVNLGLVRDLTSNGVPYIFRRIKFASPKESSEFSTGLNVDDMETRENEVGHSAGGAESPDQQKVATSTHHRQLGTVVDASSPATSVDHKDRLNVLDTEMGIGSSGSCGLTMLLEVTKLPKKIDFLHFSIGQEVRAASDSEPRMLLAKKCDIDRLPLRYSRFALFVPSILHKIEVAMVVDRLCEGLLSPVDFQNRGLVTTAISASSAREGTDYQRLEFFGDAMLKYLASLALMTEHLNWHEGILSHRKDHIVSNGSLASAALRSGLAHYILTKPFTGRKWRPMYNSTLLGNPPGTKREMSSKTLADVVEALIGAAYLDGGVHKALACLAIFLPSISWLAPSTACQTLSSAYSNPIPPSPYLTQVQGLLGHTFTSPSLLLEALTHPSHHSPTSTDTSSYQRLEYLGDAILDNIITTAAFTRDPPIPTPKLHLLRTALVNGHILGYLCLSHSIPLPRTEPITSTSTSSTSSNSDNPTAPTVSLHPTTHTFSLYQSMRHASPTVAQSQTATLHRHTTLNPLISHALSTSPSYPWSLLARLEPPKYMSDIVEAILGAIYIDTKGSLRACEGFLERIGLMEVARRIMSESEERGGGGVRLLHPKEEVGMLADRQAVRYEMGVEGEGKRKRLTCKVFVGGKEIARVGDGVGKEEVQTRGAEEACLILRGRGRGRGEGEGEEKMDDGEEGIDGEDDESSGDEEGREEMIRIDGGDSDEIDSEVIADADGEGNGTGCSMEGEEGDGDYDSDVYMTADE